MESSEIPNDDVLDVTEMVEKLESAMGEILRGNQIDLAMSALMSASINCMLSQCKTLDDIAHYRGVFFHIFDSCIRSIRIKEP